MERAIITQSHAARIRNVSRQRINELVAEGRFTTPVANGEEIHGAIYLDEVINFTEIKRGRPALKKESWFAVGTSIIWKLTPRNGYGYTLPIIGTVVRNSNKRIQIKFIGGDGLEYFAWANRDDCFIFEDGASDNEMVADTAQLEQV